MQEVLKLTLQLERSELLFAIEYVDKTAYIILNGRAVLHVIFLN